MKVKRSKEGQTESALFTLRVLNPVIPWEMRERDGEMVQRDVKGGVRPLGKQR